jgi:hypothetical protein
MQSDVNWLLNLNDALEIRKRSACKSAPIAAGTPFMLLYSVRFPSVRSYYTVH